MPRYKVDYREGDCFGVPLRTGGYATGVVARKGRGAILIGFFFGPKLSEIPQQGFAESLSPRDVLTIKRFGDLGLVRNEWKVFGAIPNWDRKIWQMPKFVRFDSNNTDIIEVVTYDEQNLSLVSKVEKAPASEAKKYYLDSMAGYGAVEISLTRLLDPAY